MTILISPCKLEEYDFAKLSYYLLRQQS